MLKVIWGPRMCSKTTKIRELIALCGRPAIIPTTGYQRAKEKFPITPGKNDRISYLMKNQIKDWNAYSDIFIDDLEFAEKEDIPIDGRIIRAACEGGIDLTVSFSPTLIDLTWHVLPLWWQALQCADEIIRLDEPYGGKEFERHLETEIPWYEYQTQALGEIVLRTKDGLFRMESLR